ncbi:MAG: capsular biosynthesis protein [Parcubacteria group bacterium CG_4_9_14_0_2_um_filter_35_11]|nr:MAG: capsular biosynthesis protein [Parcubacteria group bacterium CG_4_9_14_0_2_um_filter_35_11]
MRKIFFFLFLVLIFGGFITSVFLLPGKDFRFKHKGELISFFKPRPTEREINLIAVGDIMLSRNVDKKMEEHKDYRYPFFKTAQFLKLADITFGNLECPIIAGRDIQTGQMIFRADPQAVEGLKYAGFDVLSLANNHFPNFGEKGIKDTFLYLSEAKISYIGAGNNEEEAHRPKVFEIKGIKIAFLAYNDSDVVPLSYEAIKDHPGTAFMKKGKMQEDVKKTKVISDYLIVSMHSGTEYAKAPNQRQINFAHEAIDAGADLVIGHHPHVIQGAEEYKGKYIIYSLGNFVFDQMWSKATREGLVTKIKIKFKEGENPKIETKFYKVLIEDFSQPRILGEYTL